MTQQTEQRIEEIKRLLPAYEERTRIEHTLGVLSECRFLADFFNLAEGETCSLLTAALLHDIAKSVPEEEMSARFAQYGIDGITAAPAVRHQYLGAAMARAAFGAETVNDTVYSAISCHTTGKPGMNTVDKILFVADFTEPGRKYRTCQEMREYLHRECAKINKNDNAACLRLLNDVTKRIVGYTVTYLVEKGREVDVGTVLTWNDLLNGRAMEKGK